MKRNLGLTIIVILAVMLAACGQAAPTAAPEEAAGPIKIGMANFSQCCPYFIGMNNAVMEEAKPYSNVTIISTDANGDAAKFQADIEDLIAQGIDGIIISGAWLEEAPAALDALAAEGIPTVLVDRQFGAGSKSAYTSYIGPDNYTIGVQDGTYICDRLGGEGIVVQLRGGPADNSIGLNRSNGMLSVVENVPGHHSGHCPGLRRLERGWRHGLDGGHAGRQSEDRRRVLRERLDVPGRSDGHRRCRPVGRDVPRRRRR